MENKEYLKPILTLVLIVPFLTELLSGNFTLSKFFIPQALLIFIIIYGLAALLIRELAIKWKLGIEGIFILGLAYGIYNEGICAKTLLMAENVPLAKSFGHYSLFWGINFAWAIAIVVWHSLHAVLYPILIVTLLYPTVHKDSWLNRKWTIIFTVLVVGLGVLMFFTTPQFQAPVIYLPVFIIVVGLLAFLSKLVPKTYLSELPNYNIGIKSAILGFFFISYILGSTILGGLKAPTFVLYIYAALIIFIFYKIIKAKKWLSPQALVLFALGNYLADALFLFLEGLKGNNSEKRIAGVIFILVFIVAIFKTLKSRISPAPK